MKKKTYILTFLMMLCSFAFGQEYQWEQPKGWDASMVVYGEVTINGEAPAADLDLELGAFCGNELRGREKVKLINNRIELVIAGSESNAITFKLYDNTNKQLLDYECSTVLSFVGNEIVKGQTINFTSKNYWNPAYNTNSNMTVTAKVTINGANVTGDYEIGAFIGDEVCGSARVDANSIAYIVVSKDVETDVNETSKVTFKLWNHADNTPAAEITDVTVDYVNNADHGSQSPFVINFNEAVAKVGDKNFATLQAAVNATTSDNTEVTILRDFTLDNTVTIAKDQTVVLNLGGKTVTTAWENESAEKHYYAFTNNGTLTIKGNGTINARGIFNYGTMELTNGTINAIDGNGGYAVRNYDGATFTMNGGTIATTLEDDNKVDKGGYDATTLRVDEGATATITAGVINNICDFTLAAENYGKMTIEGGTFKSVHTTLGNHGEMTIEGGTFTCNGLEGITAHVIWATDGSNTTIDGGTFNGKDNYNGFNVDAEEGANVEITGGTFNKVHSGSLYGKGTITVSGGTFFDKVADARLKQGFACIKEADDKYTVYPNGGKIAYRAYITDEVNREAVGVDLEDVCAGKSLVVKLYDAAGNLLTTTSLKQGGDKAENYTCNIVLWGNPSSSWTTTINAELTVDNIPATIKLYVDGILVDTFENALGAGTNVDETADYVALDCVYKEAKIENTYYTSLKEAFAAAQDDDVITVVNDIELAESITNAKKVTLDLNGKTITGTDNETASFGLITNRSELTITGNGQITLKATNNRGWNAYSSVISNTVGGKLIVENGTIEHLGGTDMAYGIDNLTNGKGTYAETVVNGGTVKSPYRAIRQFLNGVEAQNILTVKGGTIEGANKSIWMQDPSKNANSGKLTVGENAVLNGDVYLFVTAGSTEWPVEVAIASVALKNGAQVLTGNVPETYVVKEVNGTWGVFGAVAKIGNTSYQTLAEAVAAAQNGETITMLADVVLTSTVKVVAGKEVTLDLNGKTIDGTGNVKIAIMSYGNLTVKDSSAEQTGTIKAGIGTAGNAINICAGTFTLESGNIYSLNNGILIDEEAATININGGTITAEPNTNNSAAFYISSTSNTVVNITEGELVGYNGILLWNNTTLNITGGSIEAQGRLGIQGNGSKDNTEINISGDVAISGAEAAIYHPQGGKLNISENATITGATGIIVKGGNVTISGGTIAATGEAAEYAPVNSGFKGTGDALYVEHYDNSTNSENYGTPVVTVTGGTFTSVNGKAVASYANANNNVEAIKNFISGGKFSTKVEEGYCATGFIPTQEKDADGYYGVKSGAYVARNTTTGQGYETLADAIAKANAAETITLLADVESSEVILIDKSLTINGDSHKVTSSASRVFRVTTSNTVVTLNGVNMVSGAAVIYPNDVRGISIDANLSNVKMTLNNCSVDFTDVSANDWTYAVNVSGNGTGHEVTVNGGTYEGANVINVHGANNTVVVKDATLNSMYPNHDVYYGSCIWVLQNQGSSVEATGNTFNGSNAVAFNLGTGTALTESNNTDNTTICVARIGNVYYTSLKDAFEAAEDDDVITVLHNVALAESITNTNNVTLDLNGKTITGTDNATASFGLITNKGNLTITGNGTITLVATNNRGWNAYSSVISNQPGGKFIVENGTIEHLGGTDMAYGIDNLTNGKGTYAETVVNGGTVKSTYRAIRQFLNGIEAQNILTVNGGTIEGANKSIWMQDPSKNANTGTLTVGENAVLNGDVYLFVTAGSTEWPVVVSIASAALKDGAQVLTGNVPETYVVKEVNGTWGVFGAVAKIGETSYQTLAEAVAAAQTGETIQMLADVELASTITIAGKTITLDLNGKTISGTCDASQSSLVYVENNAGLTVVDNTVAKEGKLIFAQGSSNVGWTVDVKGALTLNSGAIELKGSWSIGYAVDVRPNSWGTEYTKSSVFTMNGGSIVSSDGGVRVASSSAAGHKAVASSFVMNGGSIDAAWDGVFVQQSDATYDVLSFTMEGGTIESDLNPVRVYGPAATGYVNGQDCMNIEFLGGTLLYTGNEAREWVIDGILRVGGGSSIETILESGNITASEEFAQSNVLPDGYAWAANNDGTFSAVSAVAKIGTTYYASLQAAADAAENNATITVIKNFTVTETVVVSGEKNITLDINGKTITGSEVLPVIRIQGGANLTVNGGNITNEDGYIFILGASDSSSLGNLTIKGGIYHGATSVASVTYGTLNVNSGEFSVKPYQGSYAYLINCVDANYNDKANVVISGGIFHNWNPENNAAEGNNTNFCAEGYEAVEIETGVYFVMPKQQITQTTQLNKGWTWFSLYVNIDGENGLGMLQNQLQSAVSIKNYNDFTQYGLITETEYGWYGSLTSISVKDMYMIKVGEAQKISFTAYPLDPSEYTFTLNNGWTWIPYPSRTPMTLDVALANTPSEGDYIKSQDGYAEYADGKWRGSLMTLEPGRGYMYKNVSGAAKELTYTSASANRGVAPANVTAASNLMVPNMSKYANNMNITAVVNIDGEELMTEDFEVAAFAGEELRGSARPIYIESIDRYMLFLTVYGEEAEELTFKCYDLNSGEELNIFADGKIVFEVDAIEGSIAQPRVLSRGALSIDETSASSFSVYPNPVNRDNAISFETTFDRVEVYNSLGVKVAEYANVDSIDGIETAGIYVIKAANSNVVRYSRVIVK